MMIDREAVAGRILSEYDFGEEWVHESSRWICSGDSLTCMLWMESLEWEPYRRRFTIRLYHESCEVFQVIPGEPLLVEV